MAGYRALVKNIGILALANFGTKVLSFLLVPLYTTVLTTGEYGTYDLVCTTASVLVPLLSQDIEDAVLRFAIDANVEKRQVLSIGFRHFVIAIAPVFVVLLFLVWLNVYEGLAFLFPFILLQFISRALSGIVIYYARGLNRFSDIAFSSVMCSALVIGCNIYFLLFLDWGLPGYFLANVIGPLAQCVYLLFRVKLNGVNPFRVNKELERAMLGYSRPLTANAVAWWFNGVSDRYIVTLFCGVAVNGVYSAAYKLPSILNIVQSIVNQAWAVSATQEFDPDDKNGFFSNTYSIYNCILVVMSSLVIALNLILSKFMYANEFFEAWRYVPFLTVSIIFNALSGYTGGILSAVRDSKEFARSTVLGAATNVIMNLMLVPFIGAQGAALSTLLSCGLIWYLRMKTIKRHIRLTYKAGRNCFSYLLLVLQGLLFFTPIDAGLIQILEFAAFVVVLVLYRFELIAAVQRFSSSRP